MNCSEAIKIIYVGFLRDDLQIKCKKCTETSYNILSDANDNSSYFSVVLSPDTHHIFVYPLRKIRFKLHEKLGVVIINTRIFKNESAQGNIYRLGA